MTLLLITTWLASKKYPDRRSFRKFLSLNLDCKTFWSDEVYFSTYRKSIQSQIEYLKIKGII